MPSPKPAPDAEPDDAVLLRRYAREGDVAAMDELVRRHADALRGFLRGWVSDANALEDLFQDAWARVLRAPERFRGGSFRAWLLCIARNLVVDRHRRRSPALVLDAPATDDADTSPLVDVLPDENAPLPDDVLARQDLNEAVLAAVQGLPAPQREVFLLRAEDVSFADIANRLRIPLNTALGRMHYAIRHLREALSQDLR